MGWKMKRRLHTLHTPEQMRFESGFFRNTPIWIIPETSFAERIMWATLGWKIEHIKNSHYPWAHCNVANPEGWKRLAGIVICLNLNAQTLFWTLPAWSLDKEKRWLSLSDLTMVLVLLRSTPQQTPVAWRSFLPEHSYLDRPIRNIIPYVKNNVVQISKQSLPFSTLQRRQSQMMDRSGRGCDLPEHPNAFLSPAQMIPERPSTIINSWVSQEHCTISRWRKMRRSTITCNGMLMATAGRNFEKSLASQSPRVGGLGH